MNQMTNSHKARKSLSPKWTLGSSWQLRERPWLWPGNAQEPDAFFFLRDFSRSSPLFKHKSCCCCCCCCVPAWVRGRGQRGRGGEFCILSLKDLIHFIPGPLYFCSGQSNKVNAQYHHNVLSITELLLCSPLTGILLNFSIKDIYLNFTLFFFCIVVLEVIQRNIEVFFHLHRQRFKITSMFNFVKFDEG